MADKNTLFEMQVLAGMQFILNFTLNITNSTNITSLNLPTIIGPDRATVLHTTNALNSFAGNVIARPDILQNIDIVGTQSHFTDITSSSDGYANLVSAAGD